MLKKLLVAASVCFITLSINAQNNYSEISLPQLMRKWQGGNKDMIILDVRSKGEYGDSSQFKHLNIGRIKGSINITVQDLQQKPEALQQLEAYKDKEIYLICSHSYRSRTASNILLNNNFTKVTNVRGGMSEWFRNTDQLKAFETLNYEKSNSSNNISPAQLYAKLSSNEPVIFFAFKNNPRNSFDTLTAPYIRLLPEFRNIEYFTSKDSAAVLAKARAVNGKTIVLYNVVGTGGGEIAGWLSRNSIPNAYYMIGNMTGFYEDFVNYRYKDKLEKYLILKTTAKLYSAMSLCREMQASKPIQLIDLRADTLFAKPTNGTKLTYMHVRGAVNFPFTNPASEFEKQFPDKQKEYVLIGHQNYAGIELAEALLTKGYKIGWLMGGNERWEWYTNNVEEFPCKDYFVK